MERINVVLDLLYSNSGTWISDEEISRIPGISRTAVLECINILRETGYNIDSSSDGHRLVSRGDNFTEYEIKRELKTEVFGRREVHLYSETDSTNIQASRAASSGAPEGSIIIAESQTGGKGRQGRKWISPAGKNLYLSMILRPEIPAVTAPRLTLVTAVALSEALDSAGASGHRIKWPNDILFNGKKLSGILAEMKADCDSVDFVIIGTGVNINSSADDYPDDLKGSVTSLKEITGGETDRISFLNLFLHRFEDNYFDFLKGGFRGILDKWIRKSGIINQMIQVTNYRDVFTGKVTDVTPDGNLMLETPDGIRQVNTGDINFL